MLFKVDEYMRQLASLEKREAEPYAMSMAEELERLRSLEALWESMSDVETALTEARLKAERGKDGS